MKHKILVILLILMISLVGTPLMINQLISQSKPQTAFRYEVEVAFPNLSFDRPVGIYDSGDGSNSSLLLGKWA